MSDNDNHVGSFNDTLDYKGKLNYVGYSSPIGIPHTHGNGVLHIISIMLYILQMNGLLGDKLMRTPTFI